MTLLRRFSLAVLLSILPFLANTGFCENVLSNTNSLQAEPEFLEVDDAFKLEVSRSKRQLKIKWVVAEGYYLYRERFSFLLEPSNSGATLSTPQFPGKGKMKDDPAFGLVEVYDHDMEIRLSLEGTLSETLALVVNYQGCADAGLCYPPQTRRFPLADIPVTQEEGVAVAADVSAVKQTTNQAQEPASSLSIQLKEGDFLLSLLTLYLLGIGLAFTPCVLPMVPILSSIIAGQQSLTARKGFILSSVYVLAMATTYALAGALIGYFGAKANLQMYLQQPMILTAFALLFVGLALSMFGFYEIQLPAFLRDRINQLNQKQEGGSLINVAIMGTLSALVVSPCVSAPLISVLTYISSTGNALLGGGALFSLGLGMGTPLILIGAGGGKYLPKAGGWMDTVKAVFGILLLGVAVWLLERILPGPITLALWALLLIVSAVYMNALDVAPHGWSKLWKGLGVFMLIYGIILLVAAASGRSDPLRPLNLSTQETQTTAPVAEKIFQPIKNLDELQASLASAKQQGRSVMLDFYADWCISCKIMERQTFSDPKVRALLSNTLLLQADISALTPEGQAMLDHFGLFGLPSILFWSPDGVELKEARVQGEMNAEQFQTHLKQNVKL
jgi:thiol:disulfide interchange protein DsbD